jgi:hypothetical protein
MPFHNVRRWLARYPLAWVLGLALALVGAQTAGAVHELSHGLAHVGFTAEPADPFAVVVPPAPKADTSAHALSAASADHKSHLGAAGECVACLAAAALVGAAPAPSVPPILVDAPSTSWTTQVATSWTPGVLRAYASRAPPAPHFA